MNLQVGQKVVYPSHGVVTVARLVTKTVGDKQKDFAVLHTSSGMTILCPTDPEQIERAGIRKLIDLDQAQKLFALMSARTPVTLGNTAWNRRYREYFNMMSTGDLDKIAEVYRSLSILRYTKDLSFGERKMLDHAFALLAGELCPVMSLTEDNIRVLLEDAFEDLKERVA